jgi:hypothetical protein
MTARAPSGELFERRARGTPAKSLPKIEIAGDESALTRFYDSPEITAFPVLSEALGQMGLTGSAVPASRPLHLLGLGAATLFEKGDARPTTEPGDGSVVFRFANPRGNEVLEMRSFFDRGEFVEVTDDLCDLDFRCPQPRPPNDIWSEIYAEMANQFCHPCIDHPNFDAGCFGMCGPGCDCWKWVCGDCCYHPVCAVHDSYCRACDDGDAAACYWCYGPGVAQILLLADC